MKRIRHTCPNCGSTELSWDVDAVDCDNCGDIDIIPAEETVEEEEAK